MTDIMNHTRLKVNMLATCATCSPIHFVVCPTERNFEERWKLLFAT